MCVPRVTWNHRPPFIMHSTFFSLTSVVLSSNRAWPWPHMALDSHPLVRYNICRVSLVSEVILKKSCAVLNFLPPSRLQLFTICRVLLHARWQAKNIFLIPYRIMKQLERYCRTVISCVVFPIVIWASWLICSLGQSGFVVCVLFSMIVGWIFGISQ